MYLSVRVSGQKSAWMYIERPDLLAGSAQAGDIPSSQEVYKSFRTITCGGVACDPLDIAYVEYNFAGITPLSTGKDQWMVGLSTNAPGLVLMRTTNGRTHPPGENNIWVFCIVLLVTTS